MHSPQSGRQPATGGGLPNDTSFDISSLAQLKDEKGAHPLGWSGWGHGIYSSGPNVDSMMILASWAQGRWCSTVGMDICYGTLFKTPIQKVHCELESAGTRFCTQRLHCSYSSHMMISSPDPEYISLGKAGLCPLFAHRTTLQQSTAPPEASLLGDRLNRV